LDAKGYAEIQYSVGKEVVGFKLTKKGIAFIQEGGYNELDYDRFVENQKEQSRIEWESEQRKKDRKSNRNAAIIGGVVGAIAGGLVGLIVSLLTK
jgi:hypothetical protein